MNFVNLSSSCSVHHTKLTCLLGLVDRQDKEHEDGHRGGSVVSMQTQRKT